MNFKEECCLSIIGFECGSIFHEEYEKLIAKAAIVFGQVYFTSF